MAITNKITPFLWYDNQAEEAAKLYTSIFPDSKITRTTHYTSAGSDKHGREPGSVMTVEVSLSGHPFVLLNGGPIFKFSYATSFQIHCKDQAEVDHFHGKLSEGGETAPCGWLKDKFGAAWQVCPAEVMEMFKDEDKEKVDRVVEAENKMTKPEVAKLKEVFEGGA